MEEDKLISPQDLPINIYQGQIPTEFAEVIKYLPADYPYFFIDRVYRNYLDRDGNPFRYLVLFLGNVYLESERVFKEEDFDEDDDSKEKENKLNKVELTYNCDLILSLEYNTQKDYEKKITYAYSTSELKKYYSQSLKNTTNNEDYLIQSKQIYEIDFIVSRDRKMYYDLGDRIKKGSSFGKRIAELDKEYKLRDKYRAERKLAQEIEENKKNKRLNAIDRESLVLAYKVSKMFGKPIYYVSDGDFNDSGFSSSDTGFSHLKFIDAISELSDELKEYFMTKVYNSSYQEMNPIVKKYIASDYFSYSNLNPSRFYNDYKSLKVMEELSLNDFTNIPDLLVYQPIYDKSTENMVIIRVGTKDSVMYISNENDEVTVKQIFVRDSLIGMLLPDVLFGKFIE